jgi:DNA-binding MarR family transcriptional regulator
VPSRRSAEAERAADRIHSAAIRLLRFVRREDAAAAIGAPQLSVLSVLVFGGPQSISALAAAEQVRMPTMSRTVDYLVRNGLAERVTTDDRRVTIVRVTAQGKALLDDGRRRRLARLVAALRGASAEELRVLTAAAEIIMRATDSA